MKSLPLKKCTSCQVISINSKVLYAYITQSHTDWDNFTMEEPEAIYGADNLYMTMDADRTQNDTGPDSRGQRKKELRKAATGRSRQNIPNPNTAQPPIQTLPNRYITIRHPPENANRAPGKKQPQRLGKAHTQSEIINKLAYNNGYLQ